MRGPSSATALHACAATFGPTGVNSGANPHSYTYAHARYDSGCASEHGNCCA